MKRLVKDAQGNVVELSLANPDFMPPGYEAVTSEELAAASLSVACNAKMGQIRARRDSMLVQNDKLWLIASKKGESTTALEADAQTLRDLPELAQTELDALESVEDIQSYDCFEGLALSGDYE